MQTDAPYVGWVCWVRRWSRNDGSSDVVWSIMIFMAFKLSAFTGSVNEYTIVVDVVVWAMW